VGTLTDQWRKSSRSNSDGPCVEVCQVDDTVYVRDSKGGEDGLCLAFTRAQWAAFREGMAAGEFVEA
jgi:hypothetical protein